ncbi:MAG TPA: rhodanese-like domain-containing protein [Dehalococcoidales bacterium]|nr:rhodanese-like domain-containing protein [Dehalococcoidales bacterium]
MSLKNFMALVLLVSLVIGATLTGGCLRDETATIEDITPQEAFALIQDNQNNPDFVIIDVRTPAEFAGEHIENATNINFYSETFQDMLNNLDKNRTYLVYCAVGGRSGNALDIMAELNFKEAYNILGGINQWKSEGLPTVK